MNYVVGFAFTDDYKMVALIRKNRPEWQKGLLNGLGGKINPGEYPPNAMAREFKEEAGCLTLAEQWKWYATMEGTNNDGARFKVECFTRKLGRLNDLKTMEDEPLEVVRTDSILRLSNQMIDNLPWLIMAAIDHLQDGRPRFIKIKY
jgi:8-oxo-dGTP diphosphatase